MLVGGILVGSAGNFYFCMCKAMNRSLAGVIFGGFGAVVKQRIAGEVSKTGGSKEKLLQVMLL